jgi:hypothetical protein
MFQGKIDSFGDISFILSIFAIGILTKSGISVFSWKTVAFMLSIEHCRT